MTAIEAQLWVRRAAAAIAFYEAAFGAVVRHRVGDGDDVVAQLEVDGARFWVAAAAPELGRESPEDGGATARFLLVVDAPGAVIARAVAAGATETAAVAVEHGWELGRIVDPAGHEWEIGRPLDGGPPGA
ncbi:MAG: hypothetical protein JWR63_1637 [Conexibacter sp.]|nr:hypothetical protein [Conexibacter sp.]